MDDDIFSNEIAELESFIDSYARDDTSLPVTASLQPDRIPASVPGQLDFDARDDSSSGYNFLAEFQRELSERQRNEQLQAPQMQNIEAWNPPVSYPMPQYSNSGLTPAKGVNPHVPVTNYYPYTNDNPQTSFGNPQNYQNLNFPPEPTMEDLYRTMALSQQNASQGMFPQYPSGVIPDWIDVAKQPQVLPNAHPHLPTPYQQNLLFQAPNAATPPTPFNVFNPSIRDPSNLAGPHLPRPQNGFLETRNGAAEVRPKKVHANEVLGNPHQRTQVYQEIPYNTKADDALPECRYPSRDKSDEGTGNPRKSGKNQVSPKSNVQHGRPGYKNRPPVSRRRHSDDNPRIVHFDGKQIHCTKVVSGKSKAEVRNWLQNGGTKTDSVERKMRGLEIAQPKDLPKFIRMTQNYVKSEEKLRQVAEILFNKATKNPKYARNCAILCNEMSNTMIQGTKFRTVILNLMQARFQSREDMIRLTTKNEKDEAWPGFIAFLSELYLKLRTAADEKLNALVKPLYSCLFLMLKPQYLHPKISQCFFRNLRLVGSSIEKADGGSMAQLISGVRDTVVSPTAMSPYTRKYLLHSLELYARSWSTSTLDENYYNGKFQNAKS